MGYGKWWGGGFKKWVKWGWKCNSGINSVWLLCGGIRLL